MSDAISVQCPRCHTRLKLKNRSAIGKRVPCPSCKQPFVVAVPAEQEEDEFSFMNTAEPEPDPFDEPAESADSDDEPGDMPPRAPARGRKKKKSAAAPINWQKPLLIGGAGLIVVALLVGAGLGVAELLSNFPGNKIDLAYLPPDADMVIRVRVADVYGSPLLKSLLSNPAVKSQIDTFQKQYGIEPEAVTSVTIGQSGAANQFRQAALARAPQNAGAPPATFNPASVRTLAVVRLAKPVDIEQIKTAGNFTESAEHSGQAYFRTSKPQSAAGALALFAPSAQILVFGDEPVLKEAIDRGRKAPRRHELDFINPEQQILIVVVPSDPSAFSSEGPPPPGAPEAMVKLNEATRGKLKGISLGLTFTDNIAWNIATSCTTPEAVAEASAVIDKSLQDAKASLGQVKSSVPPQFSEFVVLADTVLNSIQLRKTGPVLEIVGQIPGSIKSTLEKLPLLMLSGMPPMPGGDAGAFGAPPATPPASQFPPGLAPPGSFSRQPDPTANPVEGGKPRP